MFCARSVQTESGASCSGHRLVPQGKARTIKVFSTLFGLFCSILICGSSATECFCQPVLRSRKCGGMVPLGRVIPCWWIL